VGVFLVLVVEGEGVEEFGFEVVAGAGFFDEAAA
jgi:hypothetical protein